MSTDGEWTANDLIAAMHDHGFDMNQRLIVDWVQRGLLSQPRRRGLGRGSAPAVWSDNQKQLLLALVDKRREAPRLAQLATIPIALWLIWGDDYVPTAQARRALRTWAGGASTASTRGLKRTVDDVLRDLYGERIKPALRAKLADALGALTSGLPMEIGEQRARLKAALNGADGSGAGYSAEDYLTIVEARLVGIAPFANHTDDTEYSDLDLLAARAIYRHSMANYKRTVDEVPGSDAEITTAGLAFVTTLGLQRIHSARSR